MLQLSKHTLEKVVGRRETEGKDSLTAGHHKAQQQKGNQWSPGLTV